MPLLYSCTEKENPTQQWDQLCLLAQKAVTSEASIDKKMNQFAETATQLKSETIRSALKATQMLKPEQKHLFIIRAASEDLGKEWNCNELETLFKSRPQ